MKLQSNEASSIDSISNAYVDKDKVLLGREKFLSFFENDEVLINRLKEIYIHIVNKMHPFLEPFREVEKGMEQYEIDPTNVPCERVFGLLKYAEKHVLNLQFGLLANHAIAKCNRVDTMLNSLDSNVLTSIHSDIPNIDQRLKQQQKDQSANKLQSARRERDQVYTFNILKK